MYQLLAAFLCEVLALLARQGWGISPTERDRQPALIRNEPGLSRQQGPQPPQAVAFIGSDGIRGDAKFLGDLPAGTGPFVLLGEEPISSAYLQAVNVSHLDRSPKSFA
jgi:hypothetical protein